MIERSKQRVTGLTQEQEQAAMEKGWKFWDYILALIGQADAKQLSKFVAQPERFIMNRQHTVISASDQIPVWLKTDSAKPLMRKNKIDEAAVAQKARKRRKVLTEEARKGEEAVQEPEAAEQGRNTAKAAGNPANSRCRYTVVARQLIHHYFDPAREPKGDQVRNAGLLYQGSQCFPANSKKMRHTHKTYTKPDTDRQTDN